MKSLKKWGAILALMGICAAICFAGEARAAASAQASAKHEQRQLARQRVENHSFSDFGSEYIEAKKFLTDKLGLQVGLDISYTAQRVAPGGKQTAIQGIYYPYVTWTLFQDRAWGSGALNVNYNYIHYWGQQAAVLQDRANLVSAINDYDANQYFFSQFTYTHTLPGKWDWLSVTAGQFPLYNFDGTEYVDNQQTGLMNYALSQNASSAYPLASLGAYVQAQNSRFTFAAGYQDATNITGAEIHGKTAFDGKYTGFGSFAWTPSFKWGDGQYSFLYYYQPAVAQQDENVNGWSFNMQQNIGSKLALFGRANGSTGGAVPIKNSYVLGISLLNPLGRNPQDVITLGAAYNRLGPAGAGYPPFLRSGETVIELQWVWGIGKFVTVTPDIQFYPRAGFSPDQGVTTVAGLRTTVML